MSCPLIVQFNFLVADPEEYLEITAMESIQRFAPVLRFDRAYWGLPMSAQSWFDEMLCSGNIPYDSVIGQYDYLACSQRIMEYGFLVYCLDMQRKHHLGNQGTPRRSQRSNLLYGYVQSPQWGIADCLLVVLRLPTYSSVSNASRSNRNKPNPAP